MALEEPGHTNQSPLSASHLPAHTTYSQKCHIAKMISIIKLLQVAMGMLFFCIKKRFCAHRGIKELSEDSWAYL